MAEPAFVETKSIQHFFRLQLHNGKCTLEKVEPVSGYFDTDQVQQWQTGMLCCRLISADGQLIGERTLPAPDYVCVVLDPNTESNVPAAARFTSNGPVVFQVRFPQIAGAVRLDIHRIATEERPIELSKSIGPLVASIPIPAK